MPVLVGLGGVPYLLIASGLGLVLIAQSAIFAGHRSVAEARRLFLLSIAYLPLLWGALVVDRLWL
jgi:heme O synthase-like polyprenyltransferase